MILGNIVLPVKEEKKKPIASSQLGSAADKKKRKRIRKGGMSEEEIKKVGKEQAQIAKDRAKEKYGDPRKKIVGPKPRHELTEEEPEP